MDRNSFPVDAAGRQYVFHQVPLLYGERGLKDLFGEKNNKTVAETLAHQRYNKFTSLIVKSYPQEMSKPLGKFLRELKDSGDSTYTRFLNPYGDAQYCRFSIERTSFTMKRGLYCYRLNDAIMYVGRCRDTFVKRFNQGYGVIHPKNCYLDGQATNCHLNAIIESTDRPVQLFLSPIDNLEDIEISERLLIAQFQPEWNIALRA